MAGAEGRGSLEERGAKGATPAPRSVIPMDRQKTMLAPPPEEAYVLATQWSRVVDMKANSTPPATFH